MRLLVAAALFPPAPGAVSRYAKGLVARLARQGHEVALLHFGAYTEQAGATRVRAISPRSFLPVRLARYTAALAQEAQRAQAIILLDSPAVLATAVVLLPFLPPVILVRADKGNARRLLARFFAFLVRKRSREVITAPQLEETLGNPLDPAEDRAREHNQALWRQHITEIERALNALSHSPRV
ncbi:MAG: hypothetical protein KatS3mg099_382 [Candidatus Parcubacteria bacterium]|nr:MAG: hypothetical protein KatS3mg099_382 [Candidatus Parcubacteria bacterium]